MLLSLCADMEELCPDVWFLNYTNPMAMLCWAVYEGSPIQRVEAICLARRTMAKAGRQNFIILIYSDLCSRSPRGGEH